MERQPVIHTKRLELYHISAKELITLFENPEKVWIYEGKNFTNPHRQLIDDSGPLAWRVPQVKLNEDLNKWFVRWIVLKSNREIIGSTSFHAAPDDCGMIEIGLGIAQQFSNKGFGFESLAGMWGWVIHEPEVKTLRYTVSANNQASIALIKKFGFAHVGQQLDEIDGPEEIYELSAFEFKEMNHQ